MDDFRWGSFICDGPLPDGAGNKIYYTLLEGTIFFV